MTIPLFWRPWMYQQHQLVWCSLLPIGETRSRYTIFPCRKIFSSQFSIRLNCSPDPEIAGTSSREKALTGVDSPGIKVTGIIGCDPCCSYAGVAGRCVSSDLMPTCSYIAMIVAGVRPLLVAMMVKLLGLLIVGSTDTRIHGRSESRMAFAVAKAAWEASSAA